MPEKIQGETDALSAGFLERVMRYLDGEMSAESLRTLNGELAGNSVNQKAFVRLCLVESLAAEELTSQGDLPRFDLLPSASQNPPEDILEPAPMRISPVAPTPPSTHRAPKVKPIRRGKYALAAAILVGVLVGAATLVHLRSTTVAATLANSRDAQWDAPHGGLRPGEILQAGPLVLKAGLAEIHYSNDVTMLVESPARLEIGAANGVDLHYGKLVAVVPADARGFYVQTPSARVVDLGTEFGVEVGDDQSTRLEVFRGSVQAQVIGTDSSPITRKLVADQAAVISASPARGMQLASPAPLRFVRPVEVTLANGTAYERWRTFSEALRLDASLVAYYTFDNAQAAPGLLLNRAGTGHDLDGLLGGGDPQARPTWTTGRWEQKGALAFRSGSTQRVTLGGVGAQIDFSRGSQTASAFTIAAWVYSESVKEGAGSIICRGEEWKEQFALDVRFRKFRAWIRDQANESRPTVAIVESPVLSTGSWQHVAEVYDPAQGTISLFLNGWQVARNTLGPPTLVAGDVTVIGCRGWEGGKILPPFSGKIDELAIFRRSLSADEIRRLYQVGAGGR